MVLAINIEKMEMSEGEIPDIFMQGGKSYVLFSPTYDVSSIVLSKVSVKGCEINTGTIGSLKVGQYHKRRELKKAKVTNRLIGEYGVEWPKFCELNSYVAQLIGVIIQEINDSDFLIIGFAGLSSENEKTLVEFSREILKKIDGKVILFIKRSFSVEEMNPYLFSDTTDLEELFHLFRQINESEISISDRDSILSKIRWR